RRRPVQRLRQVAVAQPLQLPLRVAHRRQQRRVLLGQRVQRPRPPAARPRLRRRTAPRPDQLGHAGRRRHPRPGPQVAVVAGPAHLPPPPRPTGVRVAPPAPPPPPPVRPPPPPPQPPPGLLPPRLAHRRAVAAELLGAVDGGLHPQHAGVVVDLDRVAVDRVLQPH